MQRLRRSFGPREPADRGRRVETGLDGRFHFARAPIGLPEGRKGEGTMTAVRKWGFAYAALFVAVVAVGYVPGFEDDEGNLFGLFKLDLYDDAATVQADYGRFMHEMPWYAYPFGQALAGLWRTTEPELTGRHWE